MLDAQGLRYKVWHPSGTEPPIMLIFVMQVMIACLALNIVNPIPVLVAMTSSTESMAAALVKSV